MFLFNFVVLLCEANVALDSISLKAFFAQSATKRLAVE